ASYEFLYSSLGCDNNLNFVVLYWCFIMFAPLGFIENRVRKSASAETAAVDVALRKSTSVNYMPTSWRNKLNHFRKYNETISGSLVRKRPALNIMKGM